MSPHYNPDKCLRVPTDSRLWISALWGVALGLLITDSVDMHGSLLTAWAIFLALAATAWTAVTLHAYSRRVVLEVMSFEHRRMMSGDGADSGRLAVVAD